MARIKPHALLIQSKKKKGPTERSTTSIILCCVAVLLIISSLIALYRHWPLWLHDRIRSRSSKFGVLTGVVPKKNQDDPDISTEQKKYDLPGYAVVTTSKGSITVELFKDASPGIVDKFLDLCQKKYFNGMPFQRVIKHYVIHGGHSQLLEPAEDWTKKGMLRSQLITSPQHEAFMLGTPKNKNNNDFDLLITTAPIPNLNDKLWVFGRVINGEEVVQEIEEVDSDQHFRPKLQVLINSVALKHKA